MMVLLLVVATLVVCLLVRPTYCLATASSQVEALLSRARSLVAQRDADAAFSTLAEIYSIDPDARGLPSLFESCLKLRVEESGDAQDRLGLASLLLDQERYDEASTQLRAILDSNDDIEPGTIEKSSSMLFRTDAACCQWDNYVEDSEKLVESLKLSRRAAAGSDPNDVPVVHPFEALKWPCISLSEATQIASIYARRSVCSSTNIHSYDCHVGLRENVPVVTVSRESVGKLDPPRKIRLGYISPDFTSQHPLAFLMQHVFRHHDRQRFEVMIYSLSGYNDDGPEVRDIFDGADSFTVLPAEPPETLAKQLQEDDLDILIDLCGYAGTDRVSRIMALRPAPIQISYMGFPASSGAPYIDYLVCDQIVVPPSQLRKYYTENIIWMPHCYFVNSHATSACHLIIKSDEERRELRRANGLPEDAFVYCCHSRPDKIDPCIFRTWLRALKQAREGRNAVLWLLRTGSKMEMNLRQIASKEFALEDDAVVFCDVAPRDEHLRRLGCADLFLDTPAYNAHTLGCDSLFATVPMISLLHSMAKKNGSEDPVFVSTEKLASRVGASLLSAAGLEEMVCDSLEAYTDLMIRCAVNSEWFCPIQRTLHETRLSCPLFDTRRWVENLELALLTVALVEREAGDVVVLDSG